jgi:hypothetical protein
LLLPILSAHDSSRAVASGAAIGVGIALTPTVGVQMPLAWVVATLFGANRVVAMALVWISNPITVLPIYYSEYLLGTRLLGYDAITSYDQFARLWTDLAQYSYLDRVLHLSGSVGFPLLAGSFLPALILGAISYPLSYWWVTRHRRRKEALSAVDPAPNPERPAESTKDTADFKVPRRVGTLLMLALFSCTDGRRVHDLRSLPPHATVAGNVEVHYAWLDGHVLAVVAPYHLAELRQDFTRMRLDEQLQLAAGTHQYLSLTFYSLRKEGDAVRFGEEGVVLRSGKGASQLESLRVADLPAARSAPRTVLAQLGGSSLPSLQPLSKLRLLLVVPRSSLSLTDPVLAWDGRELSLETRSMAAVDLQSFDQQPARGRFEQSLLPVSKAAEEVSALPEAVDSPADVARE